MEDKYNKEAIIKTYKLLAHDNETEIRLIEANAEKPSVKTFFVKSEEEFVEFCSKYSDSDFNVYCGINERSEKGNQDKDVISLNIIPIDIDPVRPKNTSANDEEIENAKKVALQMYKDLEEKGYKPCLAFSGNGFQLWLKPEKIKIDDSNREEIKQKVKYLEKTLRDKYQTNKVNIDSIHNPSRILKVIGTRSVKGSFHRLSYWLNYHDSPDSKLNEFLNKVDLSKTNESSKTLKPIESNDNSRSATEYRHICSLISKGKTKQEVFNEMQAFSKWSTSNDSYKETTYKKAKEFIEKNKIINEVEILDDNESNFDFESFKQKIIMLMATGKRNEATELIVKYILYKETVHTTRDDKCSECWIYKNGIRVPSGKTYIKEHCRQILDNLYKQIIYKDIIVKIEADTYIEQEEFFKEENIDLVAVENGVLNLKTKKIIPFSPKYKFFNKLPLVYDESKDCPNIKKFLRTVLKDEHDLSVIQELFGYCLCRNYFIEKAIIFHGKGRNGKSKTLSLFERFVGMKNISNISLHDMEKDQYSVSELFKKLVNICGDMNSTALNETGTFLKLTGRDPIHAPRKFLNRISFTNYAKLMMSANEVPKTYTQTYAFFARWIIISFPYTFVSKEEYEKEKDTPNIKLRDENIIDKISTQDEMSGLLNWALEGYDRIKKQGDFSYSTSTAEVKTKWIRNSDSVSAFIMDCVEEDYDEVIVKEDFRKIYSLYCRKYKLKTWNDKAIKNTLQTSMGAGEVQKRGDSSNIFRCWSGIKFNKNKLTELNLPIPKSHFDHIEGL